MKLTAILDIEVFSNYFLASFKETITGKVIELEMHEDQPLDTERLARLLRRHTIVTFNGASFDIPLVALALSGATCLQLKKAANVIINRNLRGWQFFDAYAIEMPKVDHIDLIEVAPGIASLKIYGGRLHCPKMQDLPLDHEAMIEPEQRALLREYCRNDLDTTLALYNKLKPQIELRENMTKTSAVDLRSKSDAQIAEAVIASEVAKISGRKIERPEILPGTAFRYSPPEFVRFNTPALQAKLEEILAAEFVVHDNGSVIEPPALKGATVAIGQGVYRLGIGGLHSSETSQAALADDEHLLVDRDVASYYPSIILRLGLMPKAMGESFLKVYQGIVDRRLLAKRSGDKIIADVLKIVVNGSFGKFGSKWSKLYSPDLLIQTTVTGQLCLLMLIESLESAGIQVVSANTDGIVIRCHKGDLQTMETAVKDWEQATGFDTEETPYRALYSRDVNNYIAIKTDGGVKLKGVYATGALAKNPVNEICNDAAVRWLRDGTSVDKTIRECNDIRKFVTIRSVKGGALKDGEYLGKAVRWYYALGVTGTIQYKTNGYNVARTDGARPLMDLPAAFPLDIDYDWYVRETLDILAAVGAFNDLG
jgi:DNA polymerase elongation subunit (family B)